MRAGPPSTAARCSPRLPCEVCHYPICMSQDSWTWVSCPPSAYTRSPCTLLAMTLSTCSAPVLSPLRLPEAHMTRLASYQSGFRARVQPVQEPRRTVGPLRPRRSETYSAGARSPCTGGVPKLSKREPGVSDCAESIESRRRNACRGVGEPRSAAAAFTVAAWLRVTSIGEHIWLSRCSMSSGSCAPARHTPVKQVFQELGACRACEGLAQCLCSSVGFTSACSRTQAARASLRGSTGVPASAMARERLRL